MAPTQTLTLLFRVVHLFMLRTCFSSMFAVRCCLFVPGSQFTWLLCEYNVYINMIMGSFNMNEKSPSKKRKKKKMGFGYMRSWMTQTTIANKRLNFIFFSDFFGHFFSFRWSPIFFCYFWRGESLLGLLAVCFVTSWKSPSFRFR